MKDYEYKLRTLLINQKGRCKSCNKLFVPGDKIELAHHIKASRGKNGNYKRYGESVVDHILNLAATHSGKCNDAQNMSRAANPIEADKLIEIIQEELNCINH